MLTKYLKWALRSIYICMQTSSDFYQNYNHLFLSNHCLDWPGLRKLCSFLASGAVFSLPPDGYILFVECWNFFFVFSFSSEHTMEVRTGNCVHHFNSPAVYCLHYMFKDFHVSASAISSPNFYAVSVYICKILFFVHAFNVFFSCKLSTFLRAFVTGILRWVKCCIIYEPTFYFFRILDF